MKSLLFTLFISLTFNVMSAQAPVLSKKQTAALRMNESVKIDAVLDETAWQQATLAHDFIQNSPDPGKPPSQQSEVRVLYDNTAIYIGALLHDTNPDSILKEMTERDNIGNSDWFAVVIDAYRDGNNGVGFIVTPAGIQFDTKFSAVAENQGSFLFSGETSWDAVWDSETKITSQGWVVELKIPYSALRFPNTQQQIWNVNFVRNIRRNRELSYWNEVNPNVQGYLNQCGEMSGISDVKSPVRLSATPYFSVYAENLYDKNGNPKSAWGRSINGGMDIKYGINDAFTLDMTLVPDFGQVRSDNHVLNLTPFEVRFDENRQFFTEGTELFNKGGLFYSRRIGGRPIGFFNVEGHLTENEEVEENPAETQLVNATKVSGRTNKGLGIGVFNAISAKEHATVRNVETGEKRSVQTSPLTNYNILVFDQNLKNNSYLTFINTNVWRGGMDYDANVSAARFQLKNKAQSYAMQGKLAVSQKYFPDSTALGHNAFLEFSRTSGRLKGTLFYSQESHHFDPNDLGILFAPNNREWVGTMNYDKNEPFGKFNEAHIRFDVVYNRLYKPDAFTDFGFGFDAWAMTRKIFAFGVFTWQEPVETFDYYEPRRSDFSRYYRWPTSWNFGGFISTDYRKKLAMDVNGNYRRFDEEGRHRFNLNISPRYRVNDRLSFSLFLGSYNWRNDVGYVTTLDGGDIIFGVRDNITLENVFNTTYIFSNKMSFSFRLRHYWAKAEYHHFGLLDEEGRLAPTSFDEFSDDSFNAFTIDAVYRWRFAPGSDIFIVWKNNTSKFSYLANDVQYSYTEGLERLGDFPQSNSLSLRVLYFIDYVRIVK